jgi:hypothetical protein
MLRVRCPECDAEIEVRPKYADEVASVYCLNHRGGADQHLRPVYMVPVLESVRCEPQPAAA